MKPPRMVPEIPSLWPEELQDLIRRVLDEREAGHWGDSHVTEIARHLMAGDGAGQLWTVGLQSGLFYRWEGTSWVRDRPRGRLLFPIREERSPAVSGPLPDPPAMTAHGTVFAEVNRVPPEPEPQKERRCAACDRLLRTGARFCTACGAKAQGD